MNDIKEKKTITVYDAGGMFLVLIFLGIPFGTIFDYIWNLIVLSVAMPRLPGGDDLYIGTGKKLLYTLIITVLGIVIDWAYFEITWDMSLGKSVVWAPAMAQWLQFIWLLLPMLMIFLVNAALSYVLFKLDRRQALILGVVMGIFTAPWLLPSVPYIFEWVI